MIEPQPEAPKKFEAGRAIPGEPSRGIFRGSAGTPRPARAVRVVLGFLFLFAGFLSTVWGGVGDPQIRTDHPWYPGELAMSTFDRLAATQAGVYERVTGRAATTDEDRALASWYWRNLHFAHGEDGCGDYFDEGFGKSDWNREYWQGLFAQGFGLCGTTHAQWTAEMERLLGHCRGRAVGVTGHNSFEVFLKGDGYGDGRWALLDHDLSTVIFDPKEGRLLSIEEVVARSEMLNRDDAQADWQRGWRVSGLHPDDVRAYRSYKTAEYLSGYAGPPPMVHLRTGEKLRRYVSPGLEDGATFVYWGRNYRAGEIPGPERSRTWVNQPEKMFRADRDAGHETGRARFGNAVYTYRPDFAGGKYREGVVDESPGHVTFEFYSPYVIGATPRSDNDWGIYEDGCANGLVLGGALDCVVRVSTDQGSTWRDGGAARDGMDLTDHVKGHRQYLLRFEAGAPELAGTELTMTTVCQLNAAVVPRLRDGENRVTFLASGKALVSAGPNRDQAQAHVVEGSLDSPRVTLELGAPRGEKVTGIFAASHNRSGNPPPGDLSYQVDYSLDGGNKWSPLVKDWKLERRAPEPPDFWSQSFTYGEAALEAADGPVRIRFHNNGGKSYRRVEAHLAYAVPKPSRLAVTFAWTEGDGELETERRAYAATPGKEDTEWTIEAGAGVETKWVEFFAE